MPFHKSCYTSRSSGYKYRTLSTSTGPDGKKPRRPSLQPEVSLIDQKFQNFQDGVTTLISKELDDTSRSRVAMHEKMEKIESKINSMVELQDNVLSMRQALNTAETTLGDLYQRIQSMEIQNELNSVKSRKSKKATRALTDDDIEREIYSSDILAAPPVFA